MSGRLCFVLVSLLVLSSLSLVKAQYQSRRLYIELELAQTNARQLDLEWSQLQLDQSTLGKHARLSEIARRDLGMVAVDADKTRYLKVGAK